MKTDTVLGPSGTEADTPAGRTGRFPPAAIRALCTTLAVTLLTCLAGRSPVLGQPAGERAAGSIEGRAWRGAKPAANCVVWVDLPGSGGAAPGSRAVLNQKNLTFIPHVLAVQVGTPVDFPNNDRVFHNVFSHRDGRKFDLGLYPVGKTRTIVFEKPGLCRIFCNIHSNMAAYIYVLETPAFAVSDRGGRFRINSVPRGTHTYHAWRPGADELKGTLTIPRSGALEVRW